MPCLDDGNLAEELPRVFEAEMIPPAPIDAYLRFYEMLSVKHRGLKPVAALTRPNIIGFRVAAGSIVPVASAPSNSTDLPEVQITQLPWERDALILKSPDATSADRILMEESTASVEEQAAEAYQYLRLTLSNWLVSTRDPRGPAAAAELSAILNLKMPLYERRKRCDILLGTIIREWLSVEQTEERKPLSILREDCLALDEAECDGVCSWSGGRCLIHVPQRSEAVDPVSVFTARLSDELLRYPSSKREIFEQKVQAIRVPRGAVRIGDELLLATKAKESAEAVLERLGFFGQMAARFPEEMLRFEGLEEEGPEDVVEPDMESEPATMLPPAWVEKGLVLVDGGTKQESFIQGTQTPFDGWEARIKKQRISAGLPGNPNRPVTWSIQDWFAVVRIVTSDILFVTRTSTGLLKISTWIKYFTPSTVSWNPMYMIFWDDSLVVRGKVYRFFQKDLPSDLIAAIDAASPMPNEEAKSGVEALVPQTESKAITKAITKAKTEVKLEVQPEVQPDVKTEVKLEVQPEVKLEVKPELGADKDESESASESGSGSGSGSNSSEASPLLLAKKPEEPKETGEKPGPSEKPKETKETGPGALAQIASASAEVVGSAIGSALESLTLA